MWWVAKGERITFRGWCTFEEWHKKCTLRDSKRIIKWFWRNTNSRTEKIVDCALLRKTEGNMLKKNENKRRMKKITSFWESKFVVLKKYYHSDHNEVDKMIRTNSRYNGGERDIEH